MDNHLNPELMFTGPFTFRVRFGQHDGQPRGEGGELVPAASERLALALAHGLPRTLPKGAPPEYAFPETLDADGNVTYWYTSETGIRNGSTSGAHDAPSMAKEMWDSHYGNCREITMRRMTKMPDGKVVQNSYMSWRKP